MRFAFRPNLSTLLLAIPQVLGVSGFILSVFNFRRDRATLRVTLQRAEDRKGGPSSSWPALFIEIANIGRRAAFVGHVGLRARNKWAFKWYELAAKEINRSLGEGDAPIVESFMLKNLSGFRKKRSITGVRYRLKRKEAIIKNPPKQTLSWPKT